MNDSNENHIAVIGDKDTVLVFKALGMDVYFPNEDVNSKEILKQLVEYGYHIILITEREAILAGDYIESLADMPYPIILPIPDGVGNYGLGMGKITANIEKASGGLKNDN